MKKLISLILMTISGILLFSPSVVLAQWCPDKFSLQGEDFDGDGIPNAEDPCCFITQKIDDLSNDVCNYSADDLLDQNGNGILASEEGMCCVSVLALNGKESPQQCYALKNARGGCPDFTIEVACDKLLVYNMMPALYGGSGFAYCGADFMQRECICYTIGDYDFDDNVSSSDDNLDDRPGPFDNCPTTPNPEQTNDDKDIWGKSCDFCPGIDDIDPALINPDKSSWGLIQCTLEVNNCPQDSKCVPWAFKSEGGILTNDNIVKWVGNFCSYSDNSDLDTYGDLCDNCPDKTNEEQLDLDDDGWGDACDPCPQDNAINGTMSLPDFDDDGIADECDNCPDKTNEEQLDLDDDGWGDACDPCPQDQNITPESDVPLDDFDNDMFADICDPCPADPQIDGFTDDLKDDDEDFVPNVCDNCPVNANEDQYNSDEDMWGEACDNCPCAQNDDQLNSDEDMWGDACDNCPHVFNNDQLDTDNNGIGDVCDKIIEEAYSGGGLVSCSFTYENSANRSVLLSILF